MRKQHVQFIDDLPDDEMTEEGISAIVKENATTLIEQHGPGEIAHRVNVGLSDGYNWVEVTLQTQDV